MADLIRLPMVDIWSESGDIQAPDSTKIRAGWGVEVVPRQWWNWMQNRVDNNVAYLLQKGVPEWSAVTDYYANKSYVQYGAIIYKAAASGTGRQPDTNPTYWTRAFADWSPSLDALRRIAPAANGVPYFNSTTTAATATSSAFGRGMWNIADAAAGRNYIGAQLANGNLTALSGVSAATNALPYFDGSTSMTTTTLSAYGRSLIATGDAGAARTVLQLRGGAITDVVSSSYDTTNGRLLRVGSYGIGSTDMEDIANSVDLTTQNVTGFYQVGSGNSTPGGYSGQMIVMTNATYYSSQIFTPQTKDGKLFIRTSLKRGSENAADFGNWNEFWTSANLVKTANRLDNTEGSVLVSGDFGLGRALDLRGTVLSTGVPSDVYNRGLVSGMAAGGPSGLAIPGLTGNSYGSLVVNSQWHNDTAISSITRTFTTVNGRVFTQTGESPTTWSAWSESASTLSPSFAGNPTAPTQANGVSNTTLATTAFVNNYTDQYGVASSNAPSVNGNSANKSGNYYYTAASSNYPDFAFVMKHTFGTNKGFEVANIPYTDRLFLRATNADGTYRTPVEMAKKSDLDGLGGDVSQKANVNSPLLTGNPRSQTPATGDNSLSIATTAFVNNSKRNFANYVLGVSNDITMTVANSATVWQFNAVCTVTLPNAASCPAGTTFNFRVPAGREGCVLAHPNGIVSEVVANTLPLSGGEVIELSNNNTAWYVVSRSNIQTVATKVQLDSLLTNVNLTGIPTAQTAAINTNTNQLATTAFVQAAKRSYSGNVIGVSSDTTITGDQTGYSFTVTAPSVTVTLPTASSATSGGTFVIRNSSSGSITVATTSGNIFIKANTAPSVVLESGEWIELQASTSNYFINMRGSYDVVASKAALAAVTNNTTLTGTPTAPKAAVGSNGTNLATTSFVQQEISYWGLGTTTSRQTSDTNASVTGGSYSAPSNASNVPQNLNGTLSVQPWSDSSACTQSFTTLQTTNPRQYIRARGSNSWGSWFEMAKTVDIANALVNTSLTGTPTAPTQAQSDNSTKLATTAYVRSAISAALALIPARSLTADRWTTARTLTLTGDITGAVSFDGSGNVSLATTLQTTNLTNYYTREQGDDRYAFSGAVGKNTYIRVDNGTVPTMSAATATFGTNGLRVSNDSNNSAIAAMSFVREGQFGTFFGLDTDNNLAMGGWSNGNRRYLIWTEKNFSVGAHIAAQVTGDVGTYGLFMLGGGGGNNPGDLISGGNLRWSSTGGNTPAASSVSGTWRLMGYVAAANFGGTGATTICLRVS